jgi:type II secretory pathway component GspD/PulD (secretin)
MLDELDAPRRQIYVEAMVLEVSDDARASQLGVELAHRQRAPATARSPSAGSRPARCRR